MRGGSLIAGRIRWATVALAFTLTVTLFIATRGAEAGVAGTPPAATVVPLGDAVQLTEPSVAAASGSKYIWTFGDGTSATGRRVRHVYRRSGYYIIRLTESRRGGGQSVFGRVVRVEPASEAPKVTGTTGPTGTTGTTAPQSTPSLAVKAQLLPQARRGVLARGLAIQLASNQAANGFATVSVPRALAKHLGITTGRRTSVVIASGTVSQVKAATMKLHLRLAATLVRRLNRLQHLTLTVRMTLVDSAGKRAGVDVTGTY